MNKIVVLNHKMNLNYDLVNEYIERIKKVKTDNKIIIIPSYLYIETFIKTDFVRIFIPFLIWNTLLALLMTASAGKLSFSFSCVVYFMSKFMTQHWYAWMLLGLYLYFPHMSGQQN